MTPGRWTRGGAAWTWGDARSASGHGCGGCAVASTVWSSRARTVATVINEQASLNLASELLGHTDPKVTIEHYIRRNEQVNPLTAELLDQAFARIDDE